MKKRKTLNRVVLNPMLKHQPNTSPSAMFENSVLKPYSMRVLSLSKAFVINKNKQITPEEFNQELDNIMEKYKYESTEKDESKGDVCKLFPKIGRNYYRKQKEDIQKILNKSKQLNKSQSSPSFYKSKPSESQNKIIRNEDYDEPLSDERRIKFDFIQENFKNPIQAFHVVQKNKVIYESMVQNYEMFEKNRYRQTFKELNPLLVKNFSLSERGGLKSPPKIKISTKIPRLIDTSWFNPGNTLNQDNFKESKKNSSMDLSAMLQEQQKTFIHSILLMAKQFTPMNSFPESREQFVFAQESSDILLCGGLVSNKSNELWEFNPMLIRWNKIFIHSVTPEPRFGHSGVIHNRKLYIFGGKLINLPILGDDDVFNLDTLTWCSPSLMTYSKMKLRRNHIACCIGNQIFIHGGIDEEGNFLNDCYLLNLNPLKWISCVINEETPSPTLAFHKCCLVLQKDVRLNSKLSIYKFPEIGIKRNLNDSNIRERGLYIFGGKESENGPAIDDLYILRIGRRPLEWAKIRTNGKGPSPRYSCSINYYEEGNCIIIHGGRNDRINSNFALNDTYILELFTMNWMRVHYCFEKEVFTVPNRCSHESVIYGHNLIIFGGMNSESIIGSQLLIIELDSNKKCLQMRDEHYNDKIIKTNTLPKKKKR